MKNDLVIIDAGHGGIDSGALGNNLYEKDLNLAVSKAMYDRFQELGVPVVLTREEDEYLPKNKRIERIRKMTLPEMNTILLSNHMNAGGGEGAEVVYSLKNNSLLAERILQAIGKEGQLMRKIYQRRLPENPSKDYYYILRESPVKEPILIEYGFIDNEKDAKKLEENLIAYGTSVADTVADYLGYEKEKETYIVEKGDTLYAIARKFNVPIEDIIELNNLTSSILQIGQILKIPGNIPEEGNYDFPEDEIPNLIQYEVKKGDSLWQISKMFDITIPDLIEMNQLSDLNIKVGQILIVPNRNHLNEFYTVKKGDTLWSIAKNNGLTVQELKEMNHLSDNMLSIGQQLIIRK